MQTHSRRRLLGVGAGAFLAAAGVRPAHAAWPDPSKPIRLVTSLAVGAGLDLLARAFGEFVSEKLGTPVIIDPRPGANGMIAMDAVARAAPDGNTLLCGVFSQYAQGTVVLKKPLLDPVKVLQPVALFGTGVAPLLVNRDFPARNFKEFMAVARARPVSYGANIIGSNIHLMMLQFAKDANAKVDVVPYKGNGPMLNDLAGGHVNCGATTLAAAQPFLQSGRLRPILILQGKRSGALPGVSTWADEGFTSPVFDLTEYYLLAAPPGTPREITNRLGQLAQEAAAKSERLRPIRQLMHEEEVPLAGDVLARYLDWNIPVWQAASRGFGLSID